MAFRQTFPITWWVWRHIFSRRCLIFAAIVVSAVFGAFLTMRLYLLHEARRADEMLAALSGVKLGDTEENVSQILGNFGGYRWTPRDEPQGDLRYVVEVNPWYWPNMAGHQRQFEKLARRIVGLMNTCPRFRRSVGLRFWTADGEIHLNRGRVAGVHVSVIVEGQDEWLGGMWNLDNEIPLFEREHFSGIKQSWPEISRYVVSWTHLHVGDGTGEGVKTWITPQASQSEMYAARHMNLSCLTSWRGCKALCNLMPEASRYHKEHPLAGWGGAWGEPELTCP